MATYDCVNDYGAQPGADYISQSANWAVCVFRFRYPTTYSRNIQASFTKSYAPGVEIRGKPLVITGDCLQLQVMQTKNQHVMQMQATLAPGINYESEIFPGDWVMAWMFTNDTDFQSVLQRLNGISAQGGVPLNGFRDGLKFVGRVSAIRKSLDQAASGHRQVRYGLSAAGFQEMDAQVFYDPLLTDQTKALGLLWGHLNADITKLLTDSKGIDINLAMPFIIDLILGKGIPKGQGHGGQVAQIATAGTEARSDDSNPDATFAYAVPGVVAQCLNVQGTSTKGILSFADILETTVGIQKYATQSPNAQNQGPIAVVQQGPNADRAIATAFMPVNLQSTDNRRATTIPLLGRVLPQAPQFNNVPVWSILNQYLNPAINEMYMCLRANSTGNVMPTFIARQFPFTTRITAEGAALDESQLATTEFLTLPTWGIDPVMVNHVDVGRSDALRFNFVHVYGSSATPGFDKTQIIYNPPIRDELDMSRSGLRPYMATVPIWVGDVINHDAGKWMAVLSDFLMGQHMTLTGTMNSIGIQAPICIGDNVEWDGDTYHIESLSHSCSIDGNGNKTFNTSLSLSHGIRTNPIADDTGNPDTGIYSFLLPSDETTFNPGITTDQSKQPDADLSVRPGNVKPPSST